jgi:hypothetical protein
MLGELWTDNIEATRENEKAEDMGRAMTTPG